MQEKKSHNAILIIDKLKKHLNINTDLDLSELLNVRPNTISTWKKRNSLDFNLIVALCEKNNIDLNDLFFNKPSTQLYVSDKSQETPLISREIQYKYCMGNLDLSTLPSYNFPSIKSAHSRAFQVTSNNMLPLIEENSYVVCESATIDSLPDDAIVVIVSKTQGLFINKLINSKNNNAPLLLRSVNPFFKDLSLNAEEINEIWLIKCVLSFNFNNNIITEL